MTDASRAAEPPRPPTRQPADPRRPSYVEVLIATGGTGGHVYPAIALADTLRERGLTHDQIQFVGGRRGIEGRVVGAAGYTITLLPGRGLQRRLTLDNLRVLLESAQAFAGALRLVRRLRPRVVVGFGAYASLPAVVAARLTRTPTVVHEQDAAPGLANRIGVRLGAHAAVSLPGTPLPGARRTGNPVRPAFSTGVRRPESPPLVAFVGGSLGAATINRAALECYDRWRARTDLTVRHVSGPRNLDEVSGRLADMRRGDDRLAYELVGYEDDVPGLYERVSLVVARAGAGTVAELTAAGVPSILVPLPHAPSDHQTRNAATLEAAGAALHLPDSQCDGERVSELVEALLGEPDRLAAMAAAARDLGRPAAAGDLADLVSEVAHADWTHEDDPR